LRHLFHNSISHAANLQSIIRLLPEGSGHIVCEAQDMLKKLVPSDATLYQSLRLRGLQESPAAFSSSPADEAGRTIAEIEARLTPVPDGSRCTFGAFVDGHLAGLVAFIRAQRVKLMHAADIAGMYVAPDFRRRGLGGQLVDAAIAHGRTLPGLRQLHLTVNASNEPARALYRSRGFACVGVQPEALCVNERYYDYEYYVLRLIDDKN
jgi:GNAT superfamily N-acetyltransferase